MQTLGASAFEGCSSLTNVVLRKGITEVGIKAFKFCKALKEVNVPEGVTKLGNYAFHYCTALETVVLPASLERIGLNGFGNCSKLSKVTCYAPVPPTLTGNVFANTPNGKALFVPAGSITQYQTTANWKAPSFASVTSGLDKVETSAQTQQATDAPQGIYTLQGVRLGEAEMLPLLPAGTYIVNGKKVMK